MDACQIQPVRFHPQCPDDSSSSARQMEILFFNICSLEVETVLSAAGGCAGPLAGHPRLPFVLSPAGCYTTLSNFMGRSSDLDSHTIGMAVGQGFKSHCPPALLFVSAQRKLWLNTCHVLNLVSHMGRASGKCRCCCVVGANIIRDFMGHLTRPTGTLPTQTDSYSVLV